jgi:hypothetical protein
MRWTGEGEHGKDYSGVRGRLSRGGGWALGGKDDESAYKRGEDGVDEFEGDGRGAGGVEGEGEGGGSERE